MFKTPEGLIAEIHNEFDTAQDRLLQEAITIVKSSDERIVSVSDRLKSIGFVNTPTVKKGSELKGKLVKSKEQAELIQGIKETTIVTYFITPT